MDDGRRLTSISFLLLLSNASDFFIPDHAQTRNSAWSVLSMYTEHIRCHTLHPYGLGGRNGRMAPGFHHGLHVLLLCRFQLLSNCSFIVIHILTSPIICISAGINQENCLASSTCFCCTLRVTQCRYCKELFLRCSPVSLINIQRQLRNPSVLN